MISVKDRKQTLYLSLRGAQRRGNLIKMLLILALTVGLLIIFASAALAGGWHYIGDVDNPDAGQWLKSRSPHSDLQTSTNNCRTCHSVHDADDGSGQKSYKLLRDKSRVTECNACHDAASGLSDKRPYGLGETTSVRGEHSLGSSVIPDADTSIIFNGIVTDGLSCGSCHSVHGANIMRGSNVDPQWENKILKIDPAGNGGDAAVSTAYGGGDIPGGFTVNSTANNYAQSKTAFCADCHNINSNWLSSDDDGNRNSKSHVQGPAADGLMSIGGIGTRVAKFGKWENQETSNASRSGWRLTQSTEGGCLSCHQAGNNFPHQSRGSKFLIDNYTNAENGWINETVTQGKAEGIRQSARGVNRADRNLASMDKVCLDCHLDQRGLGSDSLGVGKNF